MKKLIILVMLLGVYSANAGVISADNARYRYSNNYSGNVHRTAKEDNKTKSEFYIMAKAGYNIAAGSIYLTDYDNTGHNFTANAMVFGGVVGVDFNKPSIRLELEVAHVSESDADFESYLEDYTLAFTAYTFNFVQYFEINKTIELDLMVGIGAASMGLEKHSQYDDSKSLPVAFALNAGIGLDIKLSDSVSFVPQFRYTMLVGGMDWELGNTLMVHNFQFLGGLKYTF
ncbi:porin family protein [Lachnospiraceae bacterium OttesenSCG-928-E19]|nr:porin family protein [Lachnospiraceae bacterium OttesenSCG-928-E19]